MKNRLSGSPASYLLIINSGSSSVKFALFPAGSTADRLCSGKIERIGLPKPLLTIQEGRHKAKPRIIAAATHRAAGMIVLKWLEDHFGLESVGCAGHRVVHGGNHFSEPCVITRGVIQKLCRLCDWAPEHLPSAIQLMELFIERLPRLPQVACFDTAFHQTMPRVARMLAIPRRFDRKGIRRFGFHGISYSYIMEELERAAGREAARGRLVLAHLGNGSSLAAVRSGECIDTSMGFTPTSGIPMSTRSGDLDPGLLLHLARAEKMSWDDLHKLVNKQSGLLGVSETSPDVRDLLALQAKDVRAAEAVALFCYQIKKWIGAFTAALGGLDTLVFTGGIGENRHEIRARICDDLDCAGIRLDPKKNKVSAPIISSRASWVTVRVMRTDEEAMIARETERLLRSGPAL